MKDEKWEHYEHLKDSDIVCDFDKFNVESKKLEFNDWESLNFFKYYAQMGMITSGGSFLNAIGHALSHADCVNTLKIIKMWREECEKYATIYKNIEQKGDKS